MAISPDLKLGWTKKEHIILFCVLCCLVQNMFCSFCVPLSFNPYGQYVVTPRMCIWGINFDGVLNYWKKQGTYVLSTYLLS